MPLRPNDPADPKGLIHEAFRIDGITEPECRSIFVDWALSIGDSPPRDLIRTLIARHAAAPADHPMRKVLEEGLGKPPKARRRGGRGARVTDG
ncbi:hypothetical protein KUV65_01965 [Maritalea mobilis]|uniref:Uncharacterized protein n=1 Tax=[Roseibacterium] beibuensis TaxID=1193142 RepID=A0ABP9LRA4_9RHOB|nr:MULTISPECIES: hypothetical protein [Alphaproteobacteria]MBY6200112.1 hypothetical protein [Maritalea mobilis]MCS6626799.1 hypothetical protein [Roseibacterium beibuensis]